MIMNILKKTTTRINCILYIIRERMKKSNISLYGQNSEKKNFAGKFFCSLGRADFRFFECVSYISNGNLIFY